MGKKVRTVSKRIIKDRAEPKFHLAQSSLKKINEVIKGYARRDGSMRLEEIAKEIGQKKSFISVSHSFLIDIGIIQGTSGEKQSSQLGKELGRLLALGGSKEEVKKIWQEIILKTPFLLSLLDDLDSKGEIDSNTFSNRIFFLAGYNYPIPRDVSIGANALKEILEKSGYVINTDSHFSVSATYKMARNELHLKQKRKGRVISEENIKNVCDLDTILMQRCLSNLGFGSADPKDWDSIVRTAGVVVEERLHDVGRVEDPTRRTQTLVNDVFGDKGTLAVKIPITSERQGYRDLFAGFFGVFRNPSAHRFTDPTPEKGAEFVVFVNLLLSMLEDIRSHDSISV